MTALDNFVLNANERIVFHTTSAHFDVFDEAYLGTGVDNNSALGFFFSDNPENINLYIDTDRHVLVSAVHVEKPYGNLSYYELFGYDKNGGTVTSKADFAAMRDNLLINGYDSIEYEDSEEAMLIALSASSIRPLAWLSIEQAADLANQISILPDTDDDTARMACLVSVMQKQHTGVPQP